MSKYNIRKAPRKKIIFLLGAVLVLAILLFVLEKTNRTNLFGEKSVSSNIPSESPNESPDPSPDEQVQTPSTNPETTSPDKTIPASASGELMSPSGTFTSTHSIKLNDPIYNNLESICITTPGATCSIAFKKGDITKSLEAKTTNSNGTVTWTWNPNTAGLSSGSWQIVATATSGSSSKSTTDLQNLEVSQ